MSDFKRIEGINWEALKATPKLSAIIAEIEPKGEAHLMAVYQYLKMRQEISAQPTQEARDAMVEKASSIMAIFSTMQNLDANEIVRDADRMATVGVAELEALGKKTGDDLKADFKGFDLGEGDGLGADGTSNGPTDAY